MKKLIKIGAGILIGAALGFLYYKLIGCRTGTCQITNNPYLSSIYGVFLGFILTFTI